MFKKEQNRTPARSVREQSLGWMIKSLSTRMDTDINRALKPYGLDLRRFGILMTLLENEGLTQAEIGQKISMPGYATTRNIDVLEDSGLLRRDKHPSSRRSFSIYLTDKGKALAPSLFSIVKTVNDKALAQLDEKEVSQLELLLSKML